jgi:hypothetical protein
MLTRTGFEVDAAADGAVGWEALQAYEFSGHCLGLTLLGSCLTDAYNRDIRWRKEVSEHLGHDVRQGAHARKVMESYQTWFGEGPELFGRRRQYHRRKLGHKWRHLSGRKQNIRSGTRRALFLPDDPKLQDGDQNGLRALVIVHLKAPVHSTKNRGRGVWRIRF